MLQSSAPVGLRLLSASWGLLALLGGDGRLQGARAETSPWRTTSFESTLKGLAREQLLVVEVGADWCEPCNQLAMEVLDTPEALGLIAGDVGLRVDFESEEGQELKRRYGILSLPTLLFVHREGFEVGRVEGYPGRTEWLEAAREAHSGRKGLEALREVVKLRPRDPGAALDLAQARLVRHETKEALATLDALISASTESPEFAARAARIKGRWLLRVSEDAKAALIHFSAMVDRFRGTPHEAHFSYWKAESHVALGDHRSALETFAKWRVGRPDDPQTLVTQASFMVHHEYPVDAILSLLGDCAPSAETSYLLARTRDRQGDRTGALAAISDALDREPGNALYRNWQRRLETRQ